MIPPAFSLLEHSLHIPSPSYSEAAVAEYFVRQMRELNFAEAKIDKVGNAIGRWGTGPIQILFLGHIDTAPGTIPVRVHDGKLWGRGASDAKGGLCAMISALKELDPALQDCLSVTVAGCVEAECETSRGANYLAKSLPEPDYLINGEPSGWNGITIGYKGSIRFKYVLALQRSATTEQQPLANELAFQFISSIYSYIDSIKLTSQPTGQPAKQTLFQSVVLEIRDWNSVDIGVSHSVEVQCVLRIPPGFDQQAFIHFITTSATPGACTVQQVIEPFHVEPDSSLVQLLSQSITKQGGTATLKQKTGSSDIGVVKQFWQATQMIGYSPGDSKFEHTTEEQLVLSDYYASILVLRDVFSGLARLK